MDVAGKPFDKHLFDGGVMGRMYPAPTSSPFTGSVVPWAHTLVRPNEGSMGCIALHIYKEVCFHGALGDFGGGFTAAGVFGGGDHPGFTAGYNSALLLPVIVAKLTGGVTALLLALWITRPKKEA